MADYTLKDLEYWDARIREKVAEFGLDCFPQEFELCDHTQMLGYMAYSGMPSHYPHWSYGKAYEKLKTLYDYGVSGLPVRDGHQLEPGARLPDARQHALPADPDHRARLRAQRLLQEQLHLPAHARRVHASAPSRRTPTGCGRYVEDPSIGYDKVEHILDAAHALSLQCRRNLAVEEALAGRRSASALIDAATPPPDPFQSIHRREERAEPDLQQDAALARGGPAALHPRPQPVPRPTGSATCSPSSTRRRSTSSRRSRPRS